MTFVPVPDARYKGGTPTTVGQFLAKWLALTEPHMNDDRSEFLSDLHAALPVSMTSREDSNVLMRLLRRYAGHDRDCPAVQVQWHKGSCDCGWEEVDRAYTITAEVGPKLIRDDIPKHALRERGEVMPTTTVEGEVLKIFLARKLVEESLEFLRITSLEELADLAEALDAAREANGWTVDDLAAMRAGKVSRKGAFTKGVVLLAGPPKETE